MKRQKSLMSFQRIGAVGNNISILYMKRKVFGSLLCKKCSGFENQDGGSIQGEAMKGKIIVGSAAKRK